MEYKGALTCTCRYRRKQITEFIIRLSDTVRTLSRDVVTRTLVALEQKHTQQETETTVCKRPQEQHSQHISSTPSISRAF